MKIIWLGHGSFRIETGSEVLLVDPWLTGNPVLPAESHEAAIAGGTHLILTHAHFDHSADAVTICKKLGIPAVGQYDVMSWWADTQGIEVIGFNKGGTISLGEARLAMVPASHSTSFGSPEGPKAAGSEVGYMLMAEERCVYISGDTAIMADMAWMGEYYQPDIGILSAGGHFTMDMAQVAWVAKKYFSFKTIIPGHYRTFPLLEQSAAELAAALPGVRVVEPQVMQAIEL